MASTWFKRIKQGISTETKEKKEAPDGLWIKCPECKTTETQTKLEENDFVCPKCGFHHRINAKEYFKIIFDEGKFEELFSNIQSVDKLQFAFAPNACDGALLSTIRSTNRRSVC